MPESGTVSLSKSEVARTEVHQRPQVRRIANSTAVAVEVVGGKSIRPEIGRVVRISTPIPDPFPPAVVEIRTGVVAINRIGEG